MTDISKCGGQGCSKRDTCYRYVVQGSEGQSWGAFDESDDLTNCKYYWENKDEEI